MHRCVLPLVLAAGFLGCPASGPAPAPDDGAPDAAHPSVPGPRVEPPATLCEGLKQRDEFCAADADAEPTDAWCKCSVTETASGTGTLQAAAVLDYFGGADLGPTMERRLALQAGGAWVVMSPALIDVSTGDGGRYARTAHLDRFEITPKGVLVAEVSDETIDFVPEPDSEEAPSYALAETRVIGTWCWVAGSAPRCVSLPMRGSSERFQPTYGEKEALVREKIEPQGKWQRTVRLNDITLAISAVEGVAPADVPAVVGDVPLSAALDHKAFGKLAP